MQARGARMWAAISECARRDGAPVSVRHVVMTCAGVLAAAGAGLSLTRDASPGEPVLATAPVAEELEELQFTLGQGPGVDATAGRGPVLADDLAGPGAQRLWPAFAPAAADRGVRGMFAFPVAAGVALIGVLDVYRLQPGPLTAEQLARGLVCADAALMLLLDERSGITGRPDGPGGIAVGARRAQVHQATGMVAAQLGVPMSDALAALRAYAFAHGQGLADLAAEVLARRVRLNAAGEEAAQNISGPGGSADRGMRDDESDSPEPGTQSGGRHGEEL